MITNIMRLGMLLVCGILFLGSMENAFPANQKSANQDQSGVRMGTPHAWALATAALINELNGNRHDLLCNSGSGVSVASRKKDLAEWWRVTNRDDLLQTLQWLEDEGHRTEFERLGAYLSSLDDQQLAQVQEQVKRDRQAKQQVDIVLRNYAKFGRKSILGWDYVRYIYLCREGYTVGYLSEQEAWDRIMPIAALLQKTFDSWEDLGENYLVGRQFWSYEQTRKFGKKFNDLYRKLLTAPSSPWKRNPWGMDLGLNPYVRDDTKKIENNETANPYVILR